jgi:hypothetical protein
MNNWSVIYANTQKLEPTVCKRVVPGAGTDRRGAGRNTNPFLYTCHTGR